MTEASHQRLTIDQFTRQAVPFTKLPGHSTSLGLLAELSQLKGTDEVLDVACGPGIVACYFAEKAQHVTGVDLTPEMLRQARRRQEEQGVKNLEWVEGSGEGTIRGLKVANPAGFSDGTAFELEQFTVAIELASISGEPIIISQVQTLQNSLSHEVNLYEK